MIIKKGDSTQTSLLILLILFLALFILLSQFTSNFLQTMFLVFFGTFFLNISIKAWGAKKIVNRFLFFGAILFISVVFASSRHLKSERLIEGLDHDNIFHFYAIVNKTMPTKSSLPAEFAYLPMGWHKSVSQVFKLFNFNEPVDVIPAYFAIGFFSLVLFAISIYVLFRTLMKSEDSRGYRANSIILIWSLAIVLGWGLWLYWVGSLPYLYSLALTYFGISEILKVVLYEAGSSDRKTRLNLAIVMFAAASVCWPPISIILAITVLVLHMKFKIIYKFSRIIPLVAILSLPLVKTLFENRARFTSRSYPLFASDGVSGIGEFQVLPLVIVAAIIASQLIKLPQEQIPQHDIRLGQLTLFFLFIGVGVAVGIEMLFGLFSSSNTRYYSQKLFLPIALLILMILISIFFRNSKRIVKNSSVRKFAVIGSLIASTLSVSFPWGTPEWGLPGQGPTPSTTTTSVVAGSRQFFHYLYRQKAIKPLVNGTNLLKAVNSMEACRTPRQILYLDLTLEKRIGAGIYSNYWLAALQNNHLVWELANKFGSQSGRTLDSMQESTFRDLELMDLGETSFLVIDNSSIKLLNLEQSVNQPGKELEKCLANKSEVKMEYSS